MPNLSRDALFHWVSSTKQFYGLDLYFFAPEIFNSLVPVECLSFHSFRDVILHIVQIKKKGLGKSII